MVSVIKFLEDKFGDTVFFLSFFLFSTFFFSEISQYFLCYVNTHTGVQIPCLPYRCFVVSKLKCWTHFPLQVWRTDGSKQGSSCTTNFLHLHQLGKRGPCAYHNLPRFWQQLVLDHHLKSIGVSDYTETLHYTLFSFSLWLLCSLLWGRFSWDFAVIVLLCWYSNTFGG